MYNYNTQENSANRNLSYGEKNVLMKKELGRMYLKQIEVSKETKRLQKFQAIEEERTRLKKALEEEKRREEEKRKLELQKKEKLYSDLQYAINHDKSEQLSYYNTKVEEKKKQIFDANNPQVVNHNRISFDKLYKKNNEQNNSNIFGNENANYNSSHNTVENKDKVQEANQISQLFNSQPNNNSNNLSSNINTSPNAFYRKCYFEDEDVIKKKIAQKQIYKGLLDKQREYNNNWANSFLKEYGWNNEIENSEKIKLSNNVLANSTRLKRYSDWEKLYFNHNLNIKPCKLNSIKFHFYR